jgi:hypothetical protein
MKKKNLVAAILTVAFYTGRGGAMSLPQILATYDEMRALLEMRDRKTRFKAGKKIRLR